MPERQVLLVSADTEWQAVCEILAPGGLHPTALGETFEAPLGTQDYTFFHGGWGKIAAAASTQFVIDTYHPALLVNLGTCGGFEGRLQLGTILLVNRALVYDIKEAMGDPQAAVSSYSTDLDLSWLPNPFPGGVQPGVMVSADRDLQSRDVPGLVERFEAMAADWESAAIAWVARRNSVRCLILRGVTDLVGPAGDEVYGNLPLYQARSRPMVQSLLQLLPELLA